MPAVPLQLATPAGFNPDYAYLRQISPAEAMPSHAQLTWTVDQGEAWLFQLATGLFSTGAAGSGAHFTIEMMDNLGRDIYIATSTVSMGNNEIVTCSAALGVTDGGTSGGVVFDGGLHLTLPWVILPAGYQLRFLIGNEDVGSTWEGTSFATVAAWRVGPSDPTDVPSVIDSTPDPVVLSPVNPELSGTQVTHQ